MADDFNSADTTSAEPQPEETGREIQMSDNDLELCKNIRSRIAADKEHFEPRFKKMRRDMEVAKHGARHSRLDVQPGEERPYTVNITGRHIKQKTAVLYAKNPKAVARRRETLDFTVWDENDQTLQAALQTTMQFSTMQQAIGPAAHPNVPGVMAQPPVPLQVQQAQSLLQDFQQGMMRRDQIKKLGKSLEIMFAEYMRTQQPLDFKTSMKRLVRRALTTCVGYVELSFHRELGPDPVIENRINDTQTRLAHLQRLAQDIQDGDDDPYGQEIATLQHMVEAEAQAPEIVLSEGLIFDYPSSTSVIPDKGCKNIVGFVGCNHVTVEYKFTKDQTEEKFGIKLEKYAPHEGVKSDGSKTGDAAWNIKQAASDLVCVWKHYDKVTGLVYYVADGYDKWLREPGAPDVTVDDFWPLYALTFNEVEDEDDPFPPSDVELMTSMQEGWNETRQGRREHQRAARPRYVTGVGRLDDDDKSMLESAAAFETIELNNLDMGQKISDLLGIVPVPGVDPNLYDTSGFMMDTELTVGSQSSTLGATSKSTATESGIAAGAAATADSAAVDDLDSFLTRIIRASGQILLRESSPERVQKVVGPGAVWPQLTPTDIMDEVFLEVEAGSTGKPNQTAEINNFKQMAPFLVQMPAINKVWLAKQALQTLDSRLDLTEAIAEDEPSMVAQNRMAMAAPPPTGPQPPQAPEAQGHHGGANAPKPPGGQGGSGPAFGSNQV